MPFNTRVNPVDALNIKGIFQGLSQLPMMEQKARQEAEFNNARTYAAQMTGDKYGAEAADKNLTVAQRNAALASASNESTPQYQRLADLAFGRAGAGNVKDYAGGLNAGQEIATRENIMAGQVNPAIAGQAYAAVDGKPLVSAVGTTGRAMNNFTGAGNTIDATVAKLFDGKVGAETGAFNARAGASNAQAAKSYSGINVDNANIGKIGRENRKLEVETSGLLSEQGGGGAILGVPMPTVAPWSNQSNPKDANKVKAAEQTRGSKEIEKDVEAAAKEKAAAQAAARFIELNKQVDTGGVTDKLSWTRAAQGMGSNYSEMESITAQLAPAMRQPGSGSSSDYDGKQFERATLSVEKPREANANIATAIQARASLSQDYADFRQTYLEQNGTLSGADRYWKSYADKNPIFDPQKPGTFALNKQRSDWRTHFKGQSAPANNPPPANRTQPAGNPPQTNSSARKVGSKQEFDALPSGTRFIAPDGSERIKP